MTFEKLALYQRVVCNHIWTTRQSCQYSNLINTKRSFKNHVCFRPVCSKANSQNEPKADIRIPRTRRTSSYVNDECLASSVARLIYKNCSSKATLIEANPGSGVLSSAFLSAGFRQVIGLESRDEYLSDLQMVQNEYSKDRFNYFLFDLFTLWQRDLVASPGDIRYREMEADIVNFLTSRQVDKDGPVCIFGTLTDNKEHPFLSYLVQQFPLQGGIFSTATFHWYLFVSAKVYRELLRCRGDIQSKLFYNKMGIIISILFHFKIIMEVPSNKFYPPFIGKRKSRLMNSPNFDITSRYLVQLIPKPDLEDILPPDEIPRFMNFLKQLLHKKSVRLIPRLEQLVPGCGVQLIKERYTMIQSIIDLQPEHMLHIYKLLQQMPEYPDSPLHFHLSARSEHTLEEEESQHLPVTMATEPEENIA